MLIFCIQSSSVVIYPKIWDGRSLTSIRNQDFAEKPIRFLLKVAIQKVDEKGLFFVLLCPALPIELKKLILKENTSDF